MSSKTNGDNASFVILAVLDGWGIAPDAPGNAISLAKTPNFDKFMVSYPNCELVASGREVGLPKGEPGNTETGHVNLGAGRIVYQDLARINMAIAEGTFFKNQILMGAIDHVKKNSSNLHYLGLIGAGGVHSNLEHLIALIKFASVEGVKNLYLHLFTDGRDSPPTASIGYIQKVNQVLKDTGIGKIATIMGRYWAMDRDRRWDRTRKAYEAMVDAKGVFVKSAEEVIKSSYSKGLTDEFIEPSIISGDEGSPVSQINDNDAVVFFNFRIDRPRQLTKAFICQDVTSDVAEWEYGENTSDNHSDNNTSFQRSRQLDNLYFVTMTEYSKPLVESGAKVAFPPEIVKEPLGYIVSSNSKKQLRVAESEKSRFVTYYFNGQDNIIYLGEDRIIIDSPKVPTYDKVPEMSAHKTTQVIIDRLENPNPYSFVLVNYANPDMLAHTGNLGPTVKGIEVVDECLGKLSNLVLSNNGILIITADHGNAEEMINLKTGAVETEHSTNKVPFIVVARKYMGNPVKLQSGILADVAPTILALLELDTPESMTGRNLLEKVDQVPPG